MTLNGKLLAWIELVSSDKYLGAFVGEGAAPDPVTQFPSRPPATHLCSSADEARRWVEDQAAALGLPIKWLNDRPRTS